MELKEISDKLDNTHDSVIRLEGQVGTLTTLVGVYQAQISKLEGRLWGALIMSAGGMAAALLSFVMGKH